MAPTIIIIAGPTAVGKTALAIQMAQHFKTSIISADSRQCFREISIGTAKPSSQELNAVPHYFINSHHITDEVNAGVFEKYALDTAANLLQQHPVVIMVGGTGLYIKAFCEGIDPMPEIPSSIRENIILKYQQLGLRWLQMEVQHKDPLFWEQAEQQNPQRLMRALEVIEATGSSIVAYRNRKAVERPFKIITLGIEMQRNQLVENINHRVDGMMTDGLLEEVTSLQPYHLSNALQTVGYKEIFAHLNGDCTLHEAVNQIKINTRKYAKRQMTWFKKDASIHWFTQKPQLYEEAISFVTNKLSAPYLAD